MSDRYISTHPKPDAQVTELLIILMEECSEVIKCVSKLLRFGADDMDPMFSDGLTNDVRLGHEIGDVNAVVQRLLRSGVIDGDDLDTGQRQKHERLDRFLQTVEMGKPENH